MGVHRDADLLSEKLEADSLRQEKTPSTRILTVHQPRHDRLKFAQYSAKAGVAILVLVPAHFAEPIGEGHHQPM